MFVNNISFLLHKRIDKLSLFMDGKFVSLCASVQMEFIGRLVVQ